MTKEERKQKILDLEVELVWYWGRKYFSLSDVEIHAMTKTLKRTP